VSTKSNKRNNRVGMYCTFRRYTVDDSVDNPKSQQYKVNGFSNDNS
jgi:hypothetical protein